MAYILGSSLRFFLLLTIITFSTQLFGVIDFTGIIENDFDESMCIDDPGGSDLFWASHSGFDFIRFCIEYDEDEDRFYVGIDTHNPITEENVIAGDADGDGDPATTSAALAGSGADVADFAAQEFFALVLDFDHDVTNGFDLVVGVSPNSNLTDDFGAFETVSTNLDEVDTEGFYGVPSPATADIFASPSKAEPHLEFTISNVSAIAGFDEFDLDDAIDQLGLFFIMGSHSDGPIGDDLFPGNISDTTYYGFYSLCVSHLLQLDNDGDGIIDCEDLDDDNDGIPDLEELGISEFDTDGNGVLSVSQDDNANGEFDDGEEGEIGNSGIDINENDVIERDELAGGDYPDTDEDGIPDFLDDTDDSVDAGAASDSDDAVPLIAESAPLSTISLGPIDGDLAGTTDDTARVQGTGPGCSLNATATPSTIPIVMLLLGTLIYLLVRFRLRRLFFFAMILPFLLLWTPHSNALNVQRKRPPLNTLGGIFLPDSDTLGKGHFATSFSLDYAKKPLQVGSKVGNFSTDNIVDHAFTNDINFAYGIQDRLDIGIGIQTNLYHDVEPVGSSVAQQRADFGDIMLSGKYKWLPEYLAQREMGVAIEPFITLPTGSATYYNGDKGPTGGFKLIGDKHWNDDKLFANVGMKFRERENIINLSVANELQYGLGYTKSVWKDQDMHAIAEIDGSTTFRQFLSDTVSSPIDFTAGVKKYFLDGHIGATVAAGLGLNIGYGNPSLRALGLLSYNPQRNEDRDNDKIVTRYDACPDEPETENGINDRDGCPDRTTKAVSNNKTVYIEDNQIIVLQPINFEYNKDSLLTESKAILDNVAFLLTETPSIRGLLITGHTDSDGSDDYNEVLSESRAKRVAYYLASKGIDRDRMRYKGWGEGKPLVPNTSDNGKALNRRVEFHILKVDGGALATHVRREVTEETATRTSN